MINATYLKPHRTASSLRVKKGLDRLIGRTKGSTNTNLHAIADANGRSLSLLITAGRISYYTEAAAVLDDIPNAQWLLSDGGYDTAIAGLRFRCAPPPTGNGGGQDNALTISMDHPAGAAQVSQRRRSQDEDATNMRYAHRSRC